MEAKKYLQIFGILALIAMGNCSGVKDTLATSSCQCQMVNPISNFYCAGHFGGSWPARFPNARGQGLGDALAEMFDYSSLIRLDNYCSHMLLNLLCFHYFPQCDPDSDNLLAVTPCREVCIEATEACIGYARKLIPDYTFPEHLSCSNFQPGVTECNVINGASAENRCDEDCPSACPRAIPHVEFISTDILSGVEGGIVHVHLRLANVGSYNSSDTLDEDLEITITPYKIGNDNRYAQPGLDFSNSTIYKTFPKGSPKGANICVEIPVFCDNITERNKTFGVRVEVESWALFGGDFNSTNGSIKAKIINRAPCATAPCATASSIAITPTATTTLPVITPSVTTLPITTSPVATPSVADFSTDECKGRWRSRVTRRTLANNEYTFAALVRILECRGNVTVVNVTRCVNIKCGKCPATTPTILHIPICKKCVSEACSVTGDVLIAGKDINNLLYVPSYKKGGIFALPSSFISDWENSVSACT